MIGEVLRPTATCGVIRRPVYDLYNAFLTGYVSCEELLLKLGEIIDIYAGYRYNIVLCSKGIVRIDTRDCVSMICWKKEK